MIRVRFFLAFETERKIERDKERGKEIARVANVLPVGRGRSLVISANAERRIISRARKTISGGPSVTYVVVRIMTANAPREMHFVARRSFRGGFAEDERGNSAGRNKYAIAVTSIPRNLLLAR